jgi:hypothetical protein
MTKQNKSSEIGSSKVATKSRSIFVIKPKILMKAGPSGKARALPHFIG